MNFCLARARKPIVKADGEEVDELVRLVSIREGLVVGKMHKRNAAPRGRRSACAPIV